MQIHLPEVELASGDQHPRGPDSAARELLQRVRELVRSVLAALAAG